MNVERRKGLFVLVFLSLLLVLVGLLAYTTGLVLLSLGQALQFH